MTDVEKGHIATAFSFELGKVETLEVRQRVVNMIARVSRELALTVADDVGVEVPNVNESKVDDNAPAATRTPPYPMTNTRTSIITDIIAGETKAWIFASFIPYRYKCLIFPLPISSSTFSLLEAFTNRISARTLPNSPWKEAVSF